MRTSAHETESGYPNATNGWQIRCSCKQWSVGEAISRLKTRRLKRPSGKGTASPGTLRAPSLQHFRTLPWAIDGCHDDCRWMSPTTPLVRMHMLQKHLHYRLPTTEVFWTNDNVRQQKHLA